MSNGIRIGRVQFGGITRETCLDFVPEAEVGDYVIVHVGFAISRLEESEANQVFEYLREMEELADLDETQPPPSARSTPGSN